MVDRDVSERLTGRARRALALAQDEAQALQHSYIGDEHILLGLIREGEGVAAKALESLGISQEAARRQVEDIVGRGQGVRHGRLRLSPSAEKALELSRREVIEMGDEATDTEHMLLALTLGDHGVAAQVLVRLGTALSRVREQIFQLLSGDDGEFGPQTGTPSLRRAHLGGWERRMLSQVLARVESIDEHLSSIDQRLAAGPAHPDLGFLVDGHNRLAAEVGHVRDLLHQLTTGQQGGSR